MLRRLRSYLLPVGVVIVIPFFLVARFRPFSIRYTSIVPWLQYPIGVLFFAAGLLLLIITIRLIQAVGRGTLAPWDPTRRLVVQDIYRHTRNPMITGVVSMILGEAVFLASWALLALFVAFVVLNTIYFKLSEEPGLVRRFGQEYVEYRKAVPMWIPRLRPWAGGSARSDP